MKWLHITDVHIGKSDQAQTTALHSLIGLLETQIDRGGIDFALITGDLANSGKESEYEEFHTALSRPLRERLRIQNILIVPGNHDFDRDLALPSPWSSIDPHRKNHFFQNTPEGTKVRAKRTIGFGAFSQFLKKYSFQGLDPISSCASTIKLTENGEHLYVIAINTACFSDTYPTDKELTPAPTLALRIELDKIERNQRCIAIGHHPLAWFSPDTRDAFRSALAERNVVYLHGHSHAVEVEASVNGILSLGFGAAYLSPLDVHSAPIYKNSYALCKLTDSLHIALYHWDDGYGNWRETVDLPYVFRQDKRSDLLQAGYVLPWPINQNRTHDITYSKTSATATIRTSPIPTQIRSLGIPTVDMWVQLLKLLGLFEGEGILRPSSVNASQGLVEFVLPDGERRKLIRCLGGAGMLLTKAELQEEYMRMAEESFSSLTLITLGEIDENASRSATRLKASGLRVFANKDITIKLNELTTQKVATHLSGLDSSKVEAKYLLYNSGVGVLAADSIKQRWFYVISEGGDRLDPADSLVKSVREAIPEYKKLTYLKSDQSIDEQLPGSLQKPFMRDQYLHRCMEEFDDLRYDPLAAMGIRFPNTKLRDVYIPATAELGRASDQSILENYKDLFDMIPLDDNQRNQLEAQIREQVLSNSPRETGIAHKLYQSHRNVLILGDPGSGKTCFVKSEMLSYCSSGDPHTSWYRLHIPIYVPLAEAASLLTKDLSLIEVCALIAERRSLPLERLHIDQLIAAGRAAFFFDGLDEVTLSEKRAEVVEAIGNLLAEASPLGNRFVVTSRPAAVQLIEIPSELTSLTLRGLSDTEIYTLASKILTVKVIPSGSADKVRIVENQLTDHDREIIDRILADCKSNAGLHRTATNPLLLTLLVMIYSNSGPFLAKRHKIYANAVQTLVTIRNREFARQVLAEADLRSRLGHVALSLFRRKATSVPTRSEVVALIEEAMRLEPGISLPVAPNVLKEKASAFLQTVAEATGLLSIHQRTGDSSEDSVSFMHYSFLEYYAAVGFLSSIEYKTNGNKAIAELSRQVAWLEIVVLIAGLAGDHGDVTPLISQIVALQDESDEITQTRLLFAFDCALECDVPPEQTQLFLIEAARQSVRSGPGLVDSDYRDALSERLGRLLGATGSRAMSLMLKEGIEDCGPVIAAAFLDLASRVVCVANVDPCVIAAFERVCQNRDASAPIMIAIFNALSRCVDFRTELAIAMLGRGLRGNASVKLAALQAIEKVPALAAKVGADIITCLDDLNPIVATGASRAILAGGINFGSDTEVSRVLLEKCLRYWDKMTKPDSITTLDATKDRAKISAMIRAGSESERLLGIRLLPWLDREERYIYEQLISVIVGSSEHRVRVAALASLRSSSKAMHLLSMADVESIMPLLKDGHRDVRMAACRTLASLPTINSAVAAGILDYVKHSTAYEVPDGIRALVQCVIRTDDAAIKEFTYRETKSALRDIGRGRFGDSSVQRYTARLILACEEIGKPVDESLLELLANTVKDYRAPKNIRRHALRAYGKCAVPSKVSAAFMISQINANLPILHSLIGSTACDYIRKFRQKNEYLRELYDQLNDIKNALVKRWKYSNLEKMSRNDDRGLSSIRQAIREITDLLIAYSEFKAHRKAS